MDRIKEIQHHKVLARTSARELVKIVFANTNHFPANDEHFLAETMRKTVMTISSRLSSGSTLPKIEEQQEMFILIMWQLRELLKLATVAAHVKYLTVHEKAEIRDAISEIIKALDRVVYLQNGGE